MYEVQLLPVFPAVLPHLHGEGFQLADGFSYIENYVLLYAIIGGSIYVQVLFLSKTTFHIQKLFSVKPPYLLDIQWLLKVELPSIQASACHTSVTNSVTHIQICLI
jgi:hypothetical protein